MKTHRPKLVLLIGGILSAWTTAHAQTYNMKDYWIVPSGKYMRHTAVLRDDGPQSNCHGGTANGTNASWQGTLWNKTGIALQGGHGFANSRARYDIFEVTATDIRYWGTFRGNQYYIANGSPDPTPPSNVFTSSFQYMKKSMAVGESTSGTVSDNELSNQFRKVTNSNPSLSLELDVVQHFASWTDPDSGRTFANVLRVDYTHAGGTEVYYLAKGKGTVRFESGDPNEPSCVSRQYASQTSLVTYSPPGTPTLPWYDPFKYDSFVKNGFAEDFLVAPVNGGAIATYIRSWTGNSADVVISNDAGEPGSGNGTSPWHIALRASAGADYAISDLIPVTAGKTYRLSGWIFKTAAADRAYLDFNDGSGGLFADVDIIAGSTGQWVFVQGQTSVGSQTSIRVRCVRDMANQGNVYFDGITLTRLN